MSYLSLVSVVDTEKVVPDTCTPQGSVLRMQLGHMLSITQKEPICLVTQPGECPAAFKGFFLMFLHQLF